MNTLRDRRPALVLVALLLASLAALAAKRPLTPKDYDDWRSIQGQQLAPDGKHLAYALFPQDGDGELVVRNLVTGLERREKVGARPAPPPPDPLNPEQRPEARGITISFTADSHTLVFSTFPSKAEKGKPGEELKGGMVVMNLESGSVARVVSVKNFQVPETGNGFIAYQREPKSPAKSEEKKPQSESQDQARRSRSAASTGGDTEHPSDVILRKLADQSERVFPDVTEYSLTKDAATLVYAQATGVYAVDTQGGDPRPLSSGKGKYVKLAWDEKQTELAFLSDREGGKFKVYLWARPSTAAQELVSAAAAGFRKEFLISDKGAVSFSRDGRRLYFGSAPQRAERKPDATPADDRPSVDLWHWKDDFIQPMQKVRATAERNRTYRAVFHLEPGRFVQLADATLPEVTPGENGRWALGSDDRAYRRMVEHDTRYADVYLVDIAAGERKLLARKQRGAMTLSPDGKWALGFDGKDWSTISLPDGRKTNLTATLGVKFFNEDEDRPETPSSYGPPLWTKDSRYVLLNDRYDIWQVAPDGSTARYLTGGEGRRQHLQFRHVRLDADTRERDIDPAEPLLLRADHLDTHDSGFWRTRIDSHEPPRKLIMAAKYFASPVKAKKADVLLLSASTFDEFPDLLLTDPEFRELRKVSHANPQKEELLWGSAELIHYKNLDGVPLAGMLIKPENFDAHKKYPMIVYIYERLSQGLHRFVDPRPSHSINASYYASNGYLVLMPDIVYTVGYPGQSALKCVLPAIQAVADRGFLDEAAIGIQGHSWGGYQIAYMVTQTTRFRAAAAGAPVANMISAYDGIRWGPGLPRQFQYERSQSRIGGTLWEYPRRFIENSPIFMADRVTTPLMMLHNDADDAVPWYQGIEYYLALRRLGKEVYLFVYNGEPHGLRKRANQKDYTVRLQQYFDHYLKGGATPEWMERGIPYLEK
jgi:dipeptidyl aminopeptidase/acylaminoacyl peptidase